MQHQEVLKLLRQSKRLKQKYEECQSLINELFDEGTYLWEGHKVFVTTIDHDYELLLVQTCDDSTPFNCGTDNVASVILKDFIAINFK